MTLTADVVPVVGEKVLGAGEGHRVPFADLSARSKLCSVGVGDLK